MPPKRGQTSKAPAPEPPDPSTLPTPALEDQSLRMTYRIARGEQGVLTFEPYKSLLLPYWRFRTPSIASTSSAQLYAAFTHYMVAGDFVGADMARKFIQMGMTRAKRYANFKGGRKYERHKGVKGEEGRVLGSDGKGVVKDKGGEWEGREEKLRASEVFRGVWRRCVEDEEYGRLKVKFLSEQKEWDKMQKKKGKEEEGIKKEEKEGEVEIKAESDEEGMEVKEESDGD